MLREIVLLTIGALFGLGTVMAALAAPSHFPNAPSWVWHWLFWGGVALMILMVADGAWLLIRRPDWLTAVLMNVGLIFVAAALISFFDARHTTERAKIPSNPVQIVLDTKEPFVSVESAGANRRRIVRVKIENNTGVAISNGKLQVLNLDPPYRDQTEFLLRGEILIPPHGHVFVDIAYYDEGTSKAPPGKWMYLVVPSGAFFAEAIPTLPIETPHTFHLKFSTLEAGLFHEIYCRLYVDNDHVLHLEKRGSPANRQGTDFILIHDAAQIAFETAEEIGILDLVSSAHSQPPEKLAYFLDVFLVDDQIAIFGKRLPSRNVRPISRKELDSLHPVPGKSTLTSVFAASPDVYADVSMTRDDLDKYLKRLRALRDLADKQI